MEGGRLPTVVEDVVRGTAKPLYNFLNPTPNLENLPTPRITEEEFTNFASRFTTIDTGRGCVFTCDFCTIINVQGRTMRFREPKQVVDFVRQSYLDAGVKQCFFTDDNIARNPRWRELFEGLIHLREVENIPFNFMMQSDLAARKIPGGDFFVLAGTGRLLAGVLRRGEREPQEPSLAGEVSKPGDGIQGPRRSLPFPWYHVPGRIHPRPAVRHTGKSSRRISPSFRT